MGWEIIIVSKRSGLHGWAEEGNTELCNGNFGKFGENWKVLLEVPKLFVFLKYVPET